MHGYCDHCKTVFEAMGCYYHFCFCQEARPLTDQDIERGNKKKEMENMRREYIKEKGYKLKNCGSVSGGKDSKPMTRFKKCQNLLPLQKTPLYRLPCSKKLKMDHFLVMFNAI